MDKRKTPKLIVKNSSHQSDIPFLYKLLLLVLSVVKDLLVEPFQQNLEMVSLYKILPFSLLDFD